MFQRTIAVVVRALFHSMTNQRRKSASFHSHKNDLVSSGIEALETRQMLSGTGPVGTSPDTDVSYQQNFEENTDGIQIVTPATTSVFEKLGDHSLQFNDIGRTGLSLATVDLASELPETFLVSTEFEAVSGAGRWTDAFIIFDYKSETDFKFAGTFVGQNEWVIGQYSEQNFQDRRVTVDWDDDDRHIRANHEYHMEILVFGSSVELSVDGESVATYDFGEELNQNPVGLASYFALTRFDNLNVAVPSGADFPHFEGFDYGEATALASNTPEKVSVITSDSEGYLKLDSTVGGGLGLASLEMSAPLPLNFDISAEMMSVSSPGKWHDGFVIFDYVSDTDFKYAGAFHGQNQWAIGHYEGNWGNRELVVDWDDLGKTIDVGTSYEIFLDINDNSVTMRVGQELIGTAEFAENLNGGDIGLASFNANTWFKSFRVQDVIIGAYANIPISEDFESGTTGELTPVGTTTGTVSTYDDSQVLKLDNASTSGTEFAILPVGTPLPHKFNVSADLVFESGSVAQMDGFIVFDFVDELNYKYAGLKTDQVWVIGESVDGVNNEVESYLFSNEARFVDQGQKYTFHLAVNGNTAELTVNGETLVTADFDSPAYKGTVGLAVSNGSTLFDNFQLDEAIEKVVDFSPDYREDFRVTLAGQFDHYNEQLWEKQRIGGDYYNTVDGTVTGELGVLIQRTPYELPENFSIGTTLVSHSPGIGEVVDREYNGFVIFDYVDETDFKYAGFLPEAGKWIIGHYLGDFDTPITSVDASIETDEEYSIELRVYGAEVELFVGGSLMASAEFDNAVNGGDTGLGAKGAETSFGNFRLDEIASSVAVPAATDSVFAEVGGGLLD
ncbi:hypothetical protein Pla110_01590 [Polystyrenella longa]|uniref:Uncharacterized protein n=2 Tax=Polystyrenella longa TaxID=2528007 RepID=A0A518CGU9_9PLAN|nr:hypothetical protein Pla110_01590 [Polystyrenella longa]